MSRGLSRPTVPSPCASAAGGQPVGDIVIIGSGLAGLFTALKLSPLPVTVISAEPLGHGTSSGWAQGGIAAAVSEGDSPQAHAADTIRAGAGLVEERIAHLLAREAAERIEDLLNYGVPFDRDLEGRLKLSREAAHSQRRIIRVKGDMAGAAIMAAITDAARKTPSIRIIEGYSAEALHVASEQVHAVSIRPTDAPRGAAPFLLPAQAVVLASGGVGHLYAVTTNPAHARGDGIAMAARAGAVIADAEFVQFHPTALDIGRDPAPLASEALRGEGATLINSRGERFMPAVHPDAELAPRDIVARAVHEEIAAGRGAFLDCREAIGSRFPEAFPKIYEICKSAGIDPAKEPLPVAPAAHYHMGGVHTDANGRTSVNGLWACGEVASTGAHGANRLASNSLLETVVFGARIAADLKGLFSLQRMPERAPAPCEGAAATPGSAGMKIAEGGDVTALRQLMSRHVGVVRDGQGLAQAVKTLAAMETEQDAPRSLQAMALAARFIAAAALVRRESRGAHYRRDHPEPREHYARRSFLRLKDVERITEAAASDAPRNVIQAAFG
ncbi:MAG: L-aspartate oxidase [Methyloligellaceae bacterium]